MTAHVKHDSKGPVPKPVPKPNERIDHCENTLGADHDDPEQSDGCTVYNPNKVAGSDENRPFGHRGEQIVSEVDGQIVVARRERYQMSRRT